MQSLLLILGLVIVATALTETEYRTAFEEFKVKYGKVYFDAEENYRFSVFKQTLDFVNSWDAEAKGFTVGINKFADLTSEEFVALYNGVRVTKEYTPVPQQPRVDTGVTGDVVNWVNKGAVTGVKNQGQCGSCWSFSSTGSMEGSRFIANGKLISLSEQNLVDCSTSEGNQGCNGGLMDQAFQYVIQNGGIDTEASYPYTATGPNQCQYQASNSAGTISSYQDVSSGDEGALATAVAQQPTSVAIDASQPSFQSYTSGVYYEPNCSSTQLDHGVLAVGYGTDDSGNDYWIVKNSWGTDWGMSGYIQMSRNRNNNCGIATMASYPVQ